MYMAIRELELNTQIISVEGKISNINTNYKTFFFKPPFKGKYIRFLKFALNEIIAKEISEHCCFW